MRARKRTSLTFVAVAGAEIDRSDQFAKIVFGSILDNDQPQLSTVRFAAPNFGNDVSEGAGSITHTLTLSAPTSETVTVTVRRLQLSGCRR
jgi:hypothetical protein